MKIKVDVKPAAKENKFEPSNDGKFKASVEAPPVRGLANQALIKLIASNFGVDQSRVKIISGHFSRNKLIELVDFNKEI